jgi:hypothetical protein
MRSQGRRRAISTFSCDIAYSRRPVTGSKYHLDALAERDPRSAPFF